MSRQSQIRVVVASDIRDRDGIGVEIYLNNNLVMEIFRDDTKKTRAISMYTQNLPLEIIEEAIAIFKQEIPWDFTSD